MQFIIWYLASDRLHLAVFRSAFLLQMNLGFSLKTEMETETNTKGGGEAGNINRNAGTYDEHLLNRHR